MELIETASIEETDSIWGLAIDQSRQSEMKFKVGAVVVKRGKIIGFGHNKRKTHPRYGSKENFRTLHAEGAALYSCELLGNDPRGATLIVYRKNGRMSKPCESCQAIIEKAGIAKVIYTNYE